MENRQESLYTAHIKEPRAVETCKVHNYGGLGSKTKPGFDCVMCNFLTLKSIAMRKVLAGGDLKSVVDEMEAKIRGAVELEAELLDYKPEAPSFKIEKDAA